MRRQMGTAVILGWTLLCVVGAAPAAAQVCTAPADCAPGTYCARPFGACMAAGVCTTLDFACPQLVDPACGCDGRTYDNECVARANRVGVARLGSCCTGACQRPDAVSVADLMIGVGQSLGRVPNFCASFDRDTNQRVTIDELISAVRHALHGCP